MVVEDNLTSEDVRSFIKKLNIKKVRTFAAECSDNLENRKEKRKSTDTIAEDKILSKQPKIAKKETREFWNDCKLHNHVLLKNYDAWYSILSSEYDAMVESNTDLAEEKLVGIEAYMEKIMHHEVSLFQTRSADWKSDLVQSGTRKDQINAKCSLIASASIHQLALLDTLINLVKKGKIRKGVTLEANEAQADHFSREQVLMAIEALEQLWIKCLLPDRSLIPFAKRPLLKVHGIAQGDPVVRNKILIVWYFESLLQQRFKSFISNLKFSLHDTVEKIRKRAIKCLLLLLSNKPHLDNAESGLNLLNLIVDKTGDPNRTIASYASHCTASLLFKHSSLKEPLIIEAENVLFRLQSKNVSQANSKASFSNAMHYCVCFLNQIVLSKEEHKIAERLMFIYLNLFKVVSSKFTVFNENGEHKSSLAGNSQQEMRIVTNILTGIHRALPFCRADESHQLMNQIHVFYKIVHTKKLNTSVQALMILLELASLDKTQNDRFYSAFYRKLLEPGLAQSHNLSLFFNLIFKALKRDTSNKRQSAFRKRLLQLAVTSNPPFTCALFCLLSQFAQPGKGNESKGKKKDKKSQKTIVKASVYDSDDEEYFQDFDENGQERTAKLELVSQTQESSKNSEGSEFSHGGDLILGQSYKPRALNPLYAGAEGCATWELALMRDHYHPSAARFAQQVLNGEVIDYIGDPLVDFTSAKFIERYSGKKIKEKQVAKTAASPMAPKTRRFMPGTEQLLSATSTPDLTYLETYAKLCKELKANAVKDGSGDADEEFAEEMLSDDEDFDRFLDALDEQQFKNASGGVEIDDILPQDELDDEEEEDVGSELEDEEEIDAAEDDSDFVNQSDDELFL